MSRVIFSIMYAGLQLAIVKNEHGQDVTPLKPVADLFGLSWEDQRKKVTGSAYLTQLLGVCIMTMPGTDVQNREQTCILLSRVGAYQMTINPNRVRAGGNADGAKFLIEKHEEWAAVMAQLAQGYPNPGQPSPHLVGSAAATRSAT